jgi:hypothetical protein
MTSLLKGGCECGAVRYESSAEPAFSLICQCRQCQRISGSGHSPQFALPAEAVSLTGEVKFFALTGDSGNTVSSGFCPNCGNPVLKKSSGFRQFLFFHAATLDDPSKFSPQFVVWSSSKQPWDHVDPKLPLQ